MSLETALLATLPAGEHHVELRKPDGRKVRLLACYRVAGDELQWIRHDVPGSGAFDRLTALFAREPLQVAVE